MRAATIAVAGLIAWAEMAAATSPAADPPTALKDTPSKDGFPKFKVQELATDLTVGYAVILADVNNDTKPDIVVADSKRVIWYENPTWKVRTIIGAKTKPDNVCITALDIDGNGDVEFVLGAGWKPSDTQTPGTLQWLKRGKTLDEEWTVHPIPCGEPTVHRVRAFDVDGDGRPEIVHVPLQGRGASAKGNYTDGRPVRVIAYKLPVDPVAGPWVPMVLSEELHVAHNFWPWPAPLPGDPPVILVASYEGVSTIWRDRTGTWKTQRLGDGNQANPKGSRGSSEVRAGLVRNKSRVVGTIEPWHGNQVVTYTANDEKKQWDRHVVDDHLRWGHAVAFADLDGDEIDELIIGVRDDPNPKAGDTFTERRGVRIYKTMDGFGKKWDRHILEDGGVAVEDLAVGDLDGDGKPDIVAVGRQTKNVRVYWNQGK
jgi:hypothetical protein